MHCCVTVIISYPLGMIAFDCQPAPAHAHTSLQPWPPVSTVLILLPGDARMMLYCSYILFNDRVHNTARQPIKDKAHFTWLLIQFLVKLTGAWPIYTRTRSQVGKAILIIILRYNSTARFLDFGLFVYISLHNNYCNVASLTLENLRTNTFSA